jgi:outer membrane lipoprotein-sorting protein
MRKLIIALLFLLPWVAQSTPLSQSETQDLIRRIQANNLSRPSFQANFRQERNMATLKRPVINEGTVWAILPDKIRREIGGSNPSASVIDGMPMVIYYPNLKEEEVYDFERRPTLKDSIQALTAELDFQQVYSFYNIEASRDRNEYRITLTPKTATIGKVIKWVVLTIDEDLAPSKVDLVAARGEKVAVTYSDVRHKSVPDSMFQFNPPRVRM